MHVFMPAWHFTFINANVMVMYRLTYLWPVGRVMAS
jgi:hypothetical protein